MKETETIMPHDELIKLIKERAIFYFCIAFALNKGYSDVMKSENSIKFSIGDYDVELDKKQGCFILIHKVYFLRIVHAYIDYCFFIGDNEQEVVDDLLLELEKENVQKS